MIKRLLAVLALTAAVATPATAMIVYNEDLTDPRDIPALSGFATTGAMMDGMVVTACFSNPAVGCQSAVWADRVALDSGGAGIPGVFDNELVGDSFENDWTFQILSADVGQLVSLLLDGSNALTLFDRTFGNATGTDGSALGLDWDSALGDDNDIVVTYRNPTGIGGDPPVGDIFQQVFIDFGTTGPRIGTFNFVQDTDNDSRIIVKVPEPTTLALLGFAALALLRVPRRR